MATREPKALLDEPARELAAIMARAGIKNLAEWARLASERHPGVADESTIWRYATGKTRRRELRIVAAMAEVADVGVLTLDAILGNLATASKLGWPGWPTPVSAGNLALADR